MCLVQNIQRKVIFPFVRHPFHEIPNYVKINPTCCYSALQVVEEQREPGRTGPKSTRRECSTSRVASKRVQTSQMGHCGNHRGNFAETSAIKLQSIVIMTIVMMAKLLTNFGNTHTSGSSNNSVHELQIIGKGDIGADQTKERTQGTSL